MKLAVVAWVLSVTVVVGLAKQVESQPKPAASGPDLERKTELLWATVIFRHGDRTPDLEEMDLYPTTLDYHQALFPYGPKALTNKGKQRSYLVGMSLRKRYKDFISPLYLPDEITIRSTDYKRTQMTALTVLAGMYPPLQVQKWNPLLDWQPIPYDTLPYDEDDLLYWYNCPRYLWLRDKVYEYPEAKQKIAVYKDLFVTLNRLTNETYNTTQDIFYLDNLFQGLKNVGQQLPSWVPELYDKIHEVTKLEYEFEYYNSELIKLAAGVLMNKIRNLTSLYVAGQRDEQKLWLYSAHENNVAGLMAAVKVFKPHQPKYCSTFALELRRIVATGEFGIMAVYFPVANGPPVYLEIEGCGGLLCDFHKFLAITEENSLTIEDYRTQCPKKF